jgi:RecB family exonuclease
VDQLDLAGMPRRLFSCTPSKLLTWLDCPRRYRFQYVDRPMPQRGPAWAHNTVGAAVHLALARLWELPVERRTPLAARDLLARAWQTDGFESSEQAQRWRGHAADMVERYVDELDVSEQPPGVERTVAFTSEALAVSGRVDRIDDRDGELVVVDYKTGRSALTEDDARGSMALALYVLGTRRTFRRPSTRVELHHLPSGKVLSWEHTDESLARHVRRAEAIAGEATAAAGTGNYPARPSSLCAWCDFARHCPEGLEASGGPKRPWAGLAEERAPVEEV